VVRNAEGNAAGSAHDDHGVMRAENDDGRPGRSGAEVFAVEFDFAFGQSRGGYDFFDVRFRCHFFPVGLDAGARHFFFLKPEAQQGSYSQSIQPGCDVVEDDAPARREAFEAADWERFCDVEEAEEDEGDDAVTPVSGAEEEGDPLACHFVDDDKAGVVAAALACGDGGSGYA